jgi:NAD(P)-dependent dehydrogenase (short-subunit alcohol dehydrogenase family)
MSNPFSHAGRRVVVTGGATGVGAALLDVLAELGAPQATGAVMTPCEVALPLAFLGSAAASYINGHDLVADGGFNAAMATGQVDFSGLA